MRHDPAVAETRVAVRRALARQPDVGRSDTVLVAVSGGADSLALAAAAAHVLPRLGLRGLAVSVDHGLQPGSAEQAERAAGQCRGRGLDAIVRPADVGDRGGPEAAARAARYAVLEAAAEAAAAPVVLLGHTLDDQAETVLLGLARGSGARSLSAMPERNGRWLRPFLDVRRATTGRACAALGLTGWDDPHNSDRRFARSRIRHDALPVLEEALGPGVAEALARTAGLLRDDADALDDLADKAAAEDLDVPGLAALPRAVRRRALRRAAVAAGSPAGALTAAHVAAVDALVTDWRGQGPVSLPGGLVAERRCDRLTFR